MNVSTEHLAAAFDALRGADWPATLDDALRGPHRAALYLSAWRIARGQDLAAPPPYRRPPIVRPEPPHWIPFGRPSAVPGIDHKRAAAGERDDD